MIFICAKFTIKPEDADRWPEISADFTKATQAEPGCLWFEWSRSIDDPTVYVLIEAFRDEAAGVSHVNTEHFHTARTTLPPHLTTTPDIVNVTSEQDGWAKLGELAVD